MLKVGQHTVDAVHVEPEQVLAPVVCVGAAPRSGPHLGDPRPHAPGRGLDRDRPGRHAVGILEQLVSGQARLPLGRRRAPGEDRPSRQPEVQGPHAGGEQEPALQPVHGAVPERMLRLPGRRGGQHGAMGERAQRQDGLELRHRRHLGHQERPGAETPD